ncbi:MAG: SDR family NAD(P)-dependent oxidoreductase [Anaerolineae bacterium]
MGTRVLITGASGGIGLATAAAFAGEGASLALHYRKQHQPVAALADQLEIEHVLIEADLRREADADRMVDEAVGALGGLEAVVVNAGVWEKRAVAVRDMSLSQWQETMAADLTSAFLTCRAFLRQAPTAPGGPASIVLVASTAALFGEADHADYAAAKSAMAYGLNLSLKNEIVRVTPRGRVNCVCPGWTDTPMASGMVGDEALVRRATATMPLRKVARSEDVAAAIVFLTSERLAGHVSGAVLPVAGGMEGRLLHADV